jgi:hypothetical protein
MIQKRLTLASKAPDQAMTLNDEAIHGLLTKHKDDHRGIMNELFDTFQRR